MASLPTAARAWTEQMTKLRVFKTPKTAVAAVRKEGLHLMFYTIAPHCSAAGTGYAVEFAVELPEDYAEIVGRGFFATLKTVNPAL